ncbi:PREDICTED: small ubiquitin-related modifier 2-like [Nicotiana attenuata]|uniref:Small ubiquitin-related modifier 2 n=1 Tax=Nicotiana attenuata TaxID=49451 RepID=A0A314KXT8_NICAT|nr:PREDICTED: small ubiquitin-related modifier 2-like [Nicotiana attenuata]OIT34130.1 small ubiquitin-related modifier 2 [Nicotiana attenuata]
MVGESSKKRPLEEPSHQNQHLNLRIKSQDGSFVHFKVKPTSVMKEIFKAYVKSKQILEYKTFRFLFNGKRIYSKKTVNESGLKDDDEIDAMMYQHGGGHVCCVSETTTITTNLM